MKKNCKKSLLLCLCAFLLLQSLTLGVLAAPEKDAFVSDTENPYVDSDGCVIWSYHAATDTISGLGKEYTLYVPTMNIYFDAETYYSFENEITHPQAGHVHLFSYDSDPEIVELSNFSPDAIYVTERGRVSLQALEAGNAASYMVSEGILYADLAAETAIGLKDGAEKKTFDVNRLENCHAYDIVGIDGTGAYLCVYGAVYLVDGTYYYIHYMDLGNQYFDADGDFSYRKGSVEAVVLDEQEITQVQRAQYGEYREFDIIYESTAETPSARDEDGAVALFVICAVFLGFLLPLPFAIVSVCMANSKSRGKPRYWYLLTAVSVAWMTVALVLLHLLL